MTPAKARLSVVAVVGFILAFLLPPVGVIISIAALMRIPNTGESGKNLAITGTAAGFVCTALCGIMIFNMVLYPSPQTTATNSGRGTSSQSQSNPPIDPEKLTAEYLASIPVIQLKPSELQTVQVIANRAVSGTSIPATIDMRIPATCQPSHSDLGTVDEIYIMPLLSREVSLITGRTAPAVYEQEAFITKWMTIEDLKDLYLEEGDNKFCVMQLGGADSLIVIHDSEYDEIGIDVVIVVCENTKSYTDMILAVEIYLPVSSTEEDVRYAIGIGKAAMVSLMENEV
ncbi:MAG: DUF4190 domain-containing protein [Coriobacteriia bacterium]|nr:DUF4190 domain-containing protein [Coriobacteriia bacterium]